MKITEHFTAEEFACHHCGDQGIRKEFVEALEKLRVEIGTAIHINSGYRCPHHPVEAGKKKPGQHALGIAADIVAPGISQENLFHAIRQHTEFRGIGVDKGNYIHLDMRPGPTTFWKYAGHTVLPWNGDWNTL
jgi:uncharacterized protein YcbK (DUF882 family)